MTTMNDHAKDIAYCLRPISPETAARLRAVKLDGETWDETLTRLLGAQGE